MVAAGELEEIVNAFLFHQAGSEVKVRFLVLNAVIARLECTLNQVIDIDSGQDLLENIGHRHLLKDAALEGLSEEPELRRNREGIARHGLIATPLRHADTDAVEITLGAGVIGKYVNPEADALAEELIERDIGAVVRQNLKIEDEE